jgi:hypothetical protein
MRSNAQVLYRMSPDWLEMRHLEGVGVLPATPAPTETWLETYIRPDDRPQVTRAIRDAVQARSTCELEHRMRRADGSWGRVVSRGIPVLDQHGAVAEWFGTARNVTAERRPRVSRKRAGEQSRIRPSSSNSARVGPTTPKQLGAVTAHR